MKYFSKSELETGRPLISAKTAINFCLNQLYADQTHSINNLVVDGLTYKELIGSLPRARDEIELLTEV